MTKAFLLPLRAGALVLVAALWLSGCNGRGPLGDITGSIGGAPTALPHDEAGLRRFAEDWGERYDRNPKDRTVALTYARALQGLGQNAQAVAVLQGLAIAYPDDMKVLGAYGKALADAGKLRQAAEILDKAHTPERPDWSILSTQGSIADQLGDHAAARGYYEAALKIRPNEPGVLSNLGLSHALARDLPRAEETLRLAAAQPTADARVRQNLALVLALQGKFPEAEELSRRDLSPLQAKQNVAAIRQMISQSDTWRDIQSIPAPPRETAQKPGTARN